MDPTSLPCKIYFFISDVQGSFKFLFAHAVFCAREYNKVLFGVIFHGHLSTYEERRHITKVLCCLNITKVDAVEGVIR